ncbi:hypothetical protein SAMN05421693_10256 [Ectothiorhodospira magna]|uniref:Uncharacterized protein n=1 Tax=Ectothiorhodospira magna TaxID=867345 RepID=A0A1H8ZBC1_9GAMM|nr:YeeE/YedE family protein [Ectothiorhodospira magna]SEP61641.1 hypothetical protein SAMN05421693_10256 [Ectothiorhodospira magna]
MLFEHFPTAAAAVLASIFVLAFIFGAVVNKTNFCTMGAVSDWVNMGDTGRMKSWLLAIVVAMVGVILLETFGLIHADGSFPHYRTDQLSWVGHLLGGLMFGIGMTLASGCGNKTLVRIGGGNLKSILVLLIIALIAYAMTHPFPGTSHTLYSLLFHPWISPLSIQLGSAQDLGALVAGDQHAPLARLIIGLLMAAVLLFLIFRRAAFRRHLDHVLGGLVVGLVVVGAWYITGTTQIDDGMGEQHTLQAYVQDWDFLADTPEGRPGEAAPWSTQSFTFINPMGQTLRYGVSGFDGSLLYIGVVALTGVIVGSFFWAMISGAFRVEWFASVGDFFNHVIGAVLMAFGGFLAMGCTIGQGVTGLSTLALGSFITFGAIVLGSALTMKIQYYRMLYEAEATFLKAFITALVDLRLLPARLRKLEAL